MKTRYFQNSETGELHTLDEMKAIYKDWLANDASEDEIFIYGDNFNYWLSAVMTRNNGIFDEIYL